MVMKMKKQSILKRTELYWYNGTAYYTSQFVFRVHFLIITKTCVLVLEQKRNRIAVLEEQKKRIQQAMALKPAPSEHNLELKAMKSMGAMEEGDVVLGSGAEVNLDSQVCDIIGLSYLKKEKSKRNNPCQIIFSFFAKHKMWGDCWQVYWWHDKYRPRKPKYFNHVHTGYEWNKYNQTHYDHDNPPPKIVQGYKFNIFYPDLVDKTKAPVYTIEKDGSSGETCLIRFHAGPPYEDIVSE